MKNVLKFLVNLTPLMLMLGWLIATAYWARQGTASNVNVALLAGTLAAIAWLFILNVNAILPVHAVGAGITFWLTQSVLAATAFVGGIGMLLMLMGGLFIASGPTDYTSRTASQNNTGTPNRGTPPPA